MRYHWGLGVGHLHAHQYAVISTPVLEKDAQDAQPPECEPEERLDENSVNDQIDIQDGNSEGYQSDHPELCLEERDFEGWNDVESEDSEDEDGVQGEHEAMEESDTDFTGM
jgi:hypothetical protein